MKAFNVSIVFFLLVLSLSLSACSKTYVCYDGSTQSAYDKCPKPAQPMITEYAAQLAADNFGQAVALAKHDGYTRVNMYSQNGSYFVNALFTNVQSGDIKKVVLKIDGKTGDVGCTSGCEYLTTKKPAQ